MKRMCGLLFLVVTLMAVGCGGTSAIKAAANPGLMASLVVLGITLGLALAGFGYYVLTYIAQ